MEAVLERPKSKQKKKRQIESKVAGESSGSFENNEEIENEKSDEINKNENKETKEELSVENSDMDLSIGDKELKIDKPKEVGTINFERIMQKNRQIMQTIEHINSFCTEKTLNQTPAIRCTNEIKSTEEIIRPYTESQLSALYSNSELEMIEQFTKNFIEHELRGNNVRQHPLHELLTLYAQCRNKHASNNLEIEQTKRNYIELQSQLWSMNSSVIKGQGECQDGIVVQATHTYNKATFHRSCFQNLSRVLSKIRQMSNEIHVLYSYSAAIYKLQIELYLQTLSNKCIKLSGITKQNPVSLTLEETPRHLLSDLQELRLCISILFIFQRHLIRDPEFIKDTRSWLNDLIAVLLRVANYQDHIFILNHILRCPPGVGSWSTQFIQLPLKPTNSSPFSSYEINHIVTVLSLLLKPIEKRDKFLEELMQSKDAPMEALWVMVDSDGEEDEESSGMSLRENDLVAMFNQLPLDNMFRMLLCVVRTDGNDYFDSSQLTEHHILRFFAFSTLLLKVIQEGLFTYEQSRYNQFAKRLCRLIRHIVQYATDIWEIFQTETNLRDAAMMKRLQVEYDAFFLRATYCLYSSKKMGAWQFLAVVPYDLISRRCLWKIFYFLHDSDSLAQTILDPIDNTDFSEKLWDFSVRVQFEEKLNNLEDSESYYLLNTFANMALCRNQKDDVDFIEAATHDLLQIGFISKTTQETCSKNTRILLTHLTSKTPTLLSYILKIVDHNISNIGVYALYLYEELPISIWLPNEDDIEIIVRILKTNSYGSESSRWARMIIARLNWDLNPFIPYKIHCKIALLIAELVEEDPTFSQWSWAILFKLRLHITDRGISDFSKVLEPERYDVLRRGLRDQNKTIPAFLSVLVTTYGHLIPVICNKGLDQLIFLLNQQKYEAVLFALNLIVPLFLNCQESLVNCDKFQTIILGLLNADKGYLHLVSKNLQNPILEQFGHMIGNQILNCSEYEVESPRIVVRLWMNSLVSVPNWNRDFGVMYLLDVIIKISFFYTEALEVCKNTLRELLQCSTPQEQSTTITSLFKWVSSSANTPGTLLINSSLSNCPWLAYLMIDLEFEEREKITGLWKEILMQLEAQKGKVNVDAAIRKAAGNLKLPSFTSGSLCFYRWAQQALDTSVDHPLLPLIWQKFFGLYLDRIPLNGNVRVVCLGSKFFEGVINFQFQKRLKKHLQDCVNYYKEQVEECSINDNAQKLFFESCYELFRAYSLWLEEPTLQDENIYLPRLPTQCKPQLLAFIMQGNTSPWLEYLNYDKLKEEQTNSLKSWRCANYREKSKINLPHPNPGGRVESANPRERILKRLESYDTPKEAPALKISAPLVPTLDLTNKTTMFKGLEHVFANVLRFSREFNLKASEYKALDCSYLELIPQVYMSVLCVIKKQVTCNGNKNSRCSGPAVITLEIKEARINERVQHQIETNRSNYDAVCKNLLQLPPQSLCLSSVTLNQTIKLLRVKLQEDPSSLEMGVELFYHILSLINDETNSYLPAKQLFSQCVEDLGRSHIYGKEFETPRLLNKILSNPELSGLLAPHFSPQNSGTANFLLMYSTICQNIDQKFDITFALLSKFDIPHWLQSKDPKLSQRSNFIEMVVKALQSLGENPKTECLTLDDLLRKHLLSMLNHEFPEHFGEILMVLLKSSNCSVDTGYISIKVWLDFINYLAKPVEINLSIPLKDQIRQYAPQQRLLRHTELLETATLLCKHFTEERFQYGLYGLYPKTRYYVEVFMAFHGMIGHALVISTLNQHPGVLGDTLCDIIWPYLRDMFSPWILPYSMQNMKENMANWIKQLADDRSIILPWIPSDSPSAMKSVHTFFECIMFVIETLPACGKILSFVWHWYFTNFCHSSVKDHVLNVIHSSFLLLPWQNFWPTISDVELMMKVSDQYLPDCHIFLGHIFVHVNWTAWLTSLMESAPIAVKIRTYQCLLNLLVKMANEPNVHKNHTDKIKTLLIQAEAFDWTLIDHTMYQNVLDWYVMSCDSLVLFKNDPNDLDFKILHFLYSVAHYQKSNQSHDSFAKRHVYVRSYVKTIASFASRYKMLIPAREDDLKALITNQLMYFQRYRNQDELNQLMITFMEILNINGINSITLKTFEEFIMNKSKDAVFINSVLHGVGLGVVDVENSSQIYEATLATYFLIDVSESKPLSWSNITKIITFNLNKSTELERVLIQNGCILTLHAYILQKIEKVLDYKHLLSVSLDWISSIKMRENLEPKIPLLWHDILTMAVDYSEIDEPCCRSLLYRFSQILLTAAEDKEGSKWGRNILGAIGIVKPAVSVQYKFLCRALAGYILAQLPDNKGNNIQTIRKSANSPGTVGQPGGNSECPKILLKLDFGYTQGKIKECAELALKETQNPNNSLHNVSVFLINLLNQFYIKSYLRDIG
nr:ectopic P granules protein 5 homolog [Onthophagus taurus]